MSNQVGRPKGSEFTVLKAIRLTEDQAKNWNPHKIRNFLSNGHTKSKISTVRESKDEIIPDLTRLIKSEKDKIPIELYRSLKLIMKIIEER
jgi:hypothetical protein